MSDPRHHLDIKVEIDTTPRYICSNGETHRNADKALEVERDLQLARFLDSNFPGALSDWIEVAQKANWWRDALERASASSQQSKEPR